MQSVSQCIAWCVLRIFSVWCVKASSFFPGWVRFEAVQTITAIALSSALKIHKNSSLFYLQVVMKYKLCGKWIIEVNYLRYILTGSSNFAQPPRRASRHITIAKTMAIVKVKANNLPIFFFLNERFIHWFISQLNDCSKRNDLLSANISLLYVFNASDWIDDNLANNSASIVKTNRSAF